MPRKIEEVCSSVLERITPTGRERAEIRGLAKKLEERIISASEAFDIKINVGVEGSVAKDTWLSQEPDIDVFMQVPPTTPRKSLADICLKIARKATEGYKQVERFAEHPYLEAVVEGTRVNIVPCYRVERGEWLSSTDRTPFHTEYIKKRLNEEMKGEVRLLKKFMKGIHAYGAEIKVGGFSGYLCELLILHYTSFVETLREFSQYRRRIVVDIENRYKEERAEEVFQDPLTMVDPVDRSRNVASAVQPRKLYTFIAAARAFLRKPKMEFFYPPETTILPAEKLEEELSTRGSAIIFVSFEGVDVVPDVLWGQLYKSKRALHREIQEKGFNVLRDVAWSDEENINIFLFELEQQVISSVKKHRGPPLKKKKACEKFLDKYLGNPIVISGPYIEGGEWVVEIHRDKTDIVEFLEEKLERGGRKMGLAKQISRKIREKFRISVDGEITDVYERNSKFAKFLTQFLSGKPKWLEKT